MAKYGHKRHFLKVRGTEPESAFDIGLRGRSRGVLLSAKRGHRFGSLRILLIAFDYGD
jgi:hypothetical protein